VVEWDGKTFALGKGRNPFQGGMGFFTKNARVVALGLRLCRNPFQGGMGFFTRTHQNGKGVGLARRRNPFQGGMGFFTHAVESSCRSHVQVAIPFRVEWGFSPKEGAMSEVVLEESRNPFQGGMGFFTKGGR